MTDAIDLSKTYVHLGLGATAELLTDFAWTEEYLERYEREHESDGDDGRLVVVSPSVETWTSWERHPAGAELVVQLSGRAVVHQEVGGSTRTIELRAGLALINPKGVWHTADVQEPGQALFVTPGRGTEHRPR